MPIKTNPSVGKLSQAYKDALLLRLEENTRVNPESDCIEWTKSLFRGYGRTSVFNKQVRVHRLAYELAHGSIPQNLLILHKCHNRKCINVAHLATGTAKENRADCIAANRENQSFRRKLTEIQVLQIKTLLRRGWTPWKLSRVFRIQEKTVYDIRKGRIYRDVI
jgi:hypothetical protein